MRALLIAILAALVLAAPAAAAPTWLTPQNFETGLLGVPESDIAVAPNGKAVAVWVAKVGSSDLMRTSVRLPGQGFGQVSTLTATDGRNASDPHVAMDGAGRATLAWREQQGPLGVEAIRTANVPVGATAPDAPTTVSDPAVQAIGPFVAAGAGGTVVIAYQEGALGNRKVRAVVRDAAAASFSSRMDVSQVNVTAPPVAGVDDGGEVVVAWERPAGGKTVIETNSRPAGGNFGSVVTDVQTLSQTFYDADWPALAIAPDGRTVVLWSQLDTNDVRYNERTPGGTWLMEAKIASPGDVQAFAPSVAMDGLGNAIAAWNATRGTASFLQASVRPAGGAFGSSNADLTSSPTFNHVVKMNRAGDAIITFNGGMADYLGSVRRPRGGSFSGVIPAETPAIASTSVYNAGLGIDDQGNAAAVWARNVDPAGANTYEIARASFDAAPPSLTASVPAGATAGAGVGMAAAATDRLTPVSLAWSFGDGGTAAGGAVTHAFGAAGAFNVTVTATDGVGNASSATRPILISPGAPPPPPPRIDAPVLVTWGVSKTRIYLLRLKVKPVAKGTKVQLRCRGKKCPFSRISSTRVRRKAITLFKEIKPANVVGKRKRTFRARQRLQLRITRPGFIGKVVKYRLKKGKIPSGVTYCLPIGATKPRRTC